MYALAWAASPDQTFVAPFLALATLEGHFIAPGIGDRRLTLNPIIVSLSLVSRTCLWRPVVASLAVPLLIMALIVADHPFPEGEPELATWRNGVLAYRALPG